MWQFVNQSGQTIDRIEAKGEAILKDVAPTRLIDGANITFSNFVRENVRIGGAALFNGTVTSESSDVLDEIADATSEDVVDKLNALIAELKAAGIMKAS